MVNTAFTFVDIVDIPPALVDILPALVDRLPAFVNILPALVDILPALVDIPPALVDILLALDIKFLLSSSASILAYIPASASSSNCPLTPTSITASITTSITASNSGSIAASPSASLPTCIFFYHIRLSRISSIEHS
ncbi:hypothetical protein GYMLUDRAFT_250475 [Collybiopsis luxurians FD-317 M1]|uniref:Uncharacterized protein n=1 Tax=Collybiopsis luxurians FD-317 M1 TaxID=944289 RepID=A0A0D0BUX3_9AGAR|nr:hypothetical protein GYMLUDRAFT_250475 [Collybiopsis luxurians FD-317 M1]